MSKFEKINENKDLSYYLNLPWSYTIETEIHEGTSYYIIRVNELPGICTDSASLEEGMDEIKDLIACAVVIYQEKGEPIPEPIDRKQFKGNVLYRTNSERHYLIAKTAQRMHKSISKTLEGFLKLRMPIIDKGLENLSSVRNQM